MWPKQRPNRNNLAYFGHGPGVARGGCARPAVVIRNPSAGLEGHHPKARTAALDRGALGDATPAMRCGEVLRSSFNLHSIGCREL